jgi:hypothetical protein
MWFDLHTTRWMYSEAGQKLIHQMGGWAGENYRTAQRFLHPSAYYTNKMASAYDALTGAKPGTGLSQLGYAYGGDGWLKGEYLSGGIKSAVDFVVAGTAGMFTTMALQPDPILATVDPTTFERLRANAALEGDATFRALSWAPTSLDQQEAYGYGMRAQGATTLALGAYGLVRAGAGAAAGAFRTESVVSFDAASASASFQGRYPYYGIDELVNTSLPEGSLVVQVTHSVDGVPVSSYFTRVESLDAAALPGGGFDANALNQGLQTFPGRREAFRPYAQIYQVAEDIPFGGAATGPTTANQYFNPGHYRGLDQVFILPELQSNLRPTVRYELQNTRTPTYTPIDEVINNMLRQDTN